MTGHIRPQWESTLSPYPTPPKAQGLGLWLRPLWLSPRWGADPSCPLGAHPPTRPLDCSPLSARNNDPFEWTVQFGELSAVPSIWNLQAYYNRYQVEEIIFSPRYRGTTAYDIAMLRLSSAVTYNKFIQPICVLASSVDFENRTDCWVTGWGDVQEDEGEAGDRRWVWGRGARV